METINNTKTRIAVAVVCVAAVSLYFTVKQWRHGSSRRRRKSSCYLDTEAKPQYAFKKVLADNSYSPFNHLKHVASNNGELLHPYEKEIKALVENAEIDFSFFNEHSKVETESSYHWIDSESKLRQLVEVMSKEKVIGVDTEQHSLRSFRGFTALIQISTGKEDYLVDTIALHDFMSTLRPVFADSGICKVFHGADNDVIWLQKDFHIYVVNLFDTAKACEILSKPQKSLAYLLETYCGVVTNKLLQREDWRQRPLSEEMIRYARIDAHYLLYIARCLIDELSEKEKAPQDEKLHFLLEASRRSNSTSLQLYMKEDEDFPGASAASSILYRELPDPVSNSSDGARFQDLVRKLCAWRDLMARIHDESLRYVLSDQAIVALSNKSSLNGAEVLYTIYQAEKIVEPSPSLPSPSPIILSHWEDFLLLRGNTTTDQDFILTILQRHLGAGGSCPLSIQNYALLSKFNLKLTGKTAQKQNGVRRTRHVGRKASRELFVRKFSCKAPVYHNCRIYANDGRLLCYCDRRKLEWYVQRNLAKLVDENPPAIMLLFEPKGRPEDEDNDFYIQSKKNMCVVCGERNHYLRYRIIPSCYRIHFPEHLKSHRSHDIVLLCVDCHEVAHAAAEKYKREVAAEFGMPLFVRRVTDCGQGHTASESTGSAALDELGVSPLQLRTAAMALLRHGQSMPSKRREELIEIVKKYYGGREISQEDLENAMLVGMSPHERKKFEKKRGMSCKQVAAAIFQDIEQEQSTGNSGPLDSHGIANELFDSNGEKQYVSGNRGIVSQTHDNSVQKLSPEVGFQDKENDIAINEEATVEMKDVLDDSVERSSSKGVFEMARSGSDGAASKKSGLKASLLGHGPHGKQVVDYLLKNHGEDGISEFCQRWRQVFVDCLKPRHLPAGWDIKHRRDFGEFSVYKPSHKTSGEPADAS